MFEKYNYRVWLEEEVLDKLGLEDLIPTDSLHIFIERGEVEGVYDGGKVRELRGVSAEEIEEMVEEHNLAWERATDTEKILIDRDELVDAVRDTIHKAAGFQRHGGEIQLYGELDGLVVTGFQMATFAGHNSWQEGPEIVHLYTCKWFDPMEHEDFSEWLEGELIGRDELVAEFVEHLKAEELDWEEPHREWDEFSRKYPELWSEFLNKWQETWLDVNIDDMVDEAIRRIEEYEEIELINE